MPSWLAKLIDWIDARVDKPASEHNIVPGSEKMITDEDMAKPWADGVRARRGGAGLGPNTRNRF